MNSALELSCERELKANPGRDFGATLPVPRAASLLHHIALMYIITLRLRRNRHRFCVDWDYILSAFLDLACDDVFAIEVNWKMLDV